MNWWKSLVLVSSLRNANWLKKSMFYKEKKFNNQLSRNPGLWKK